MSPRTAMRSSRACSRTFATADAAARRLLARIERPAMSTEEVRLWGAADAEIAAAVRTVWRAYLRVSGRGWLGYPIEDEHASERGPLPRFRGGYITWDAAAGRSEAYR